MRSGIMKMPGSLSGRLLLLRKICWTSEGPNRVFAISNFLLARKTYSNSTETDERRHNHPNKAKLTNPRKKILKKKKNDTKENIFQTFFFSFSGFYVGCFGLGL